MAKRGLYVEMNEGLQALERERRGEIVLCTNHVQRKAKASISGTKKVVEYYVCFSR